MEPRIIKTDEQYRRSLAEVEELAAQDPDSRSADGARLELLAKLVEDYEKNVYPFAKPDPVDAILFRMEQQGLRQKDIADLLGGKNRASEILSRKRPLTLPMIRALHERLDIPATLLIREPASEYFVDQASDDGEVPVTLMVSRGWTLDEAGARNLWQRLMTAPSGSPAFLKHTLTFGRHGKTNLTNVWLWLARVRDVADSREHVHARFQRSDFTEDMIGYVARLSWMPDGPRSAIKFLEDRGIAVVIEPHLPKTHLDGAAMLSSRGTPVVGLTLREDRLDNFWFTLIHELVHAWKHLDAKGYRAIVDEKIERPDSENDGIEKEANGIAAEILIPRAHWKRSQAYRRPSAESIHALAESLQVNPAVVAGRIRHERRDFSLFSKLIGLRQVRTQFPETRWSSP
ncbi:MAG: ImmA/IrrE family metallo-endopeptidase [Gammaproteobacteria bacterium]